MCHHEEALEQQIDMLEASHGCYRPWYYFREREVVQLERRIEYLALKERWQEVHYLSLCFHPTFGHLPYVSYS